MSVVDALSVFQSCPRRWHCSDRPPDLLLALPGAFRRLFSTPGSRRKQFELVMHFKPHGFAHLA